MRVEYTDSVTFLTEGMAKAVHERVRRERRLDDHVQVERDGVVVIVRAQGVGRDDGGTLRKVEAVKARVEELGREAAEYEWLRPMFE